MPSDIDPLICTTRYQRKRLRTHAPISVVIPAYNAAETLGACLKSVLTQSLPPMEVIVVDDGSQDATSEIARSFGRAVTLLRQENQGSAVARQAGTECASEDHVAYLDADDWWPESRLATCVEILEMDTVHFLHTDFIRAVPGADPADHLPRNTSFYPWFIDYLGKQAVALERPNLFRLPQPRALDSLLTGFPYYPSASIARRQTILEVGGWDRRFRRCQDFDIALRITRRYPMHFLNEILATVGINAGHKDLVRYVIQQSLGNIKVLEAHHADHASDLQYQRQIAHTIGRRYYALGNTYQEAGQIRAARDAYRKSISWPGKKLKAFIRMLTLPPRLEPSPSFPDPLPEYPFQRADRDLPGKLPLRPSDTFVSRADRLRKEALIDFGQIRILLTTLDEDLEAPSDDKAPE
jgi:glycosyltransferase involved in cell wall biosynthesis